MTMRETSQVPRDLRLVYEVMLREVVGYPVTGAQLAEAVPLYESFLRDIRRLDELALDDVEPAATFTLHHVVKT